MRNTSLEKLSWPLIFAGLLTASLGVFAHEHSAALGWTLMAGGGTAVAVGGVMIIVRSRRPD